MRLSASQKEIPIDRPTPSLSSEEKLDMFLKKIRRLVLHIYLSICVSRAFFVHKLGSSGLILNPCPSSPLILFSLELLEFLHNPLVVCSGLSKRILDALLLVLIISLLSIYSALLPALYVFSLRGAWVKDAAIIFCRLFICSSKHFAFEYTKWGVNYYNVWFILN